MTTQANTQASSQLVTNWDKATFTIENYTNAITEEFDTPKLFARASAYHLISATLGQFFRCTHGAAKIRPNVWLVISSIPGRIRRSTLSNRDSYVLEKAWKIYLKDEKIEIGRAHV